MLTVKLNNGDLELVSSEIPVTTDNEELGITKENQAGDPNKAQESKNQSGNNGGTNASGNTSAGNSGNSNANGSGNGSANGGENNPTTSNPAPALGASAVLLIVSFAVSRKKRR